MHQGVVTTFKILFEEGFFNQTSVATKEENGVVSKGLMGETTEKTFLHFLELG